MMKMCLRLQDFERISMQHKITHHSSPNSFAFFSDFHFLSCAIHLTSMATWNVVYFINWLQQGQTVPNTDYTHSTAKICQSNARNWSEPAHSWQSNEPNWQRMERSTQKSIRLHRFSVNGKYQRALITLRLMRHNVCMHLFRWCFRWLSINYLD